MRQWPRIAGRARWLRFAERRHRLGGNHPGGYGGGEALGQERAERRGFPALNVAGGPVVQQTEPGDVGCRPVHWNRLAQRIAFADPDAQFQLVIQVPAWAEIRGFLPARLALAVRPADLPAGNPHRRGAAMIGNRHVFVVWHQRVVGAVQLAAIHRVTDAGEEIGIVADPGRQMQRTARGVVQQPRGDGRVRIGRGAFQQFRYPPAQRAPRRGAGFQQRVQRSAGSGFGGVARQAGEQSVFQRHGDIEDGITDRHAAPRATMRRAEDAKGQVLNREIRMAVGGAHPAGAGRVVGFVDHLGYLLFIACSGIGRCHSLGELMR